jgi:diguanylate cyclase (GGDEF)-like protein
MRDLRDGIPESLIVLPDPGLFRAARWMQRFFSVIAVLIILYELILLFSHPNSAESGALRASVPLLVTSLACAARLLLSDPAHTSKASFYAGRLAGILAVFGAAGIVFWTRALMAQNNPLHQSAPPAILPFGFIALTLTIVLVDNANWLVNRGIDLMVSVLFLLSMLFTSEPLFTRLGLFDHPTLNANPLLLVILVVLTFAVALRQAEHGVLSIFLGVGHGSRLARIFAPVLLILPFAWEAANARFPGRLGAGVIAASGGAVALGILLYFAWRMTRMENEIHDLVLRDEATRLYNFRGFHMLAEHALRLAKRSSVPFSVLFLELENLVDIHEQFGAEAAGASLAEAGEILRATFRESDIKGRIGAADFAVAGRFDRAGISVATLRLEAATAARVVKQPGPVALRFSMGHVTTTNTETQETLKDLLSRAGQAKNRLDSQLSEVHVN